MRDKIRQTKEENREVELGHKASISTREATIGSEVFSYTNPLFGHYMS